MHMVLRRERIKKVLSRHQWDVARHLLKAACDPETSQPDLEELAQLSSQPGADSDTFDYYSIKPCLSCKFT